MSSNVREVTIYNSSLQLCMWKSKDLYHLYQKNQNLFLFCTKMTYFVTFFVMKRYKLLLFSTKKSHIIVTLQYLKDTNHYFVKRKRYKTLLFCRKRHISLLLQKDKILYFCVQKRHNFLHFRMIIPAVAKNPCQFTVRKTFNPQILLVQCQCPARSDNPRTLLDRQTAKAA